MEMVFSAGGPSSALAPPSVLVTRPAYEPSKNPVLVYLAGLAPSSRRTMSSAIKVLAHIIAGREVDPLLLEWHKLRYEHTSYIRSLLAERYAPSTANRHVSALRGILREAWRLGWMTAEDHLRATDIKPIRGSRLPAGREISQGELKALFGTCDETPMGRRDGCMLSVLFGGGLRRAEGADLDVEDIDLEQGAVRVRCGKGNKERRVFLASGAIGLIERWLAVRGDEPGPLLVPVRRGGHVVIKRLTSQSIFDALRALGERAGVSGFSPHDLRRTWVSALLDAGADLVTVQRLAGHADPSVTSRYCRKRDRAMQKASRLLHLPVVGVPVYER